MNLPRRALVVAGLSVGLAVAACGHSPTTPSTGTSSSNSIALTRPTTVSPAAGAVVPMFGNLTLVAQNAAPTAPTSDPIILTFEIATDTSFQRSRLIAFAAVQQSVAATTSVSVNISMANGTPLYWRVRAGSGEAAPTMSDVVSISVGPADPKPANGFTSTPILVEPRSGSRYLRTVTFTAINASHSPGPTAYTFEASKTPVFTPHGPNFFPYSVDEQPGTSSTSGSMTLGTGHYYGRIKTMTLGNADSLAQGVHSPYSPVVEFDVAPQTLEAPRPADYTDLFAGRPVVSVANSARTGIAGPISYQFDVYTNFGHYGQGLIVSGIALESSTGVTSWTPPVDLATGLQYSWRSHAIDVSTGLAGDEMLPWRFTVVSRATQLMTVTVLPIGPGPCGSARGSSSTSASSAQGLAASQLSIQGVDGLAIDLVRTGPQTFSGTISGSAGAYRFLDGADRATTTATMMPDGSVQGAATGKFVYAGGIIDQLECNGAYAWTARAR